MAVQARRIQIIIARNLVTRLTRGKPSVNLSTFDMLARTALPSHLTKPLLTVHSLRPTPEISRYAKPSR